MPAIKLQSLDGEVFDVDIEVVKASITIKTLLDELGIEESMEICVPEVNAAVLKKVLEWVEYHKNDLPATDDSLRFKQQNLLLDAWDQEFFKTNEAQLFELILAAKYLDIKGLFDSSHLALANFVSVKAPEENRKIKAIQKSINLEKRPVKNGIEIVENKNSSDESHKFD